MPPAAIWAAASASSSFFIFLWLNQVKRRKMVVWNAHQKYQPATATTESTMKPTIKSLGSRSTPSLWRKRFNAPMSSTSSSSGAGVGGKPGRCASTTCSRVSRHSHSRLDRAGFCWVIVNWYYRLYRESVERSRNKILALSFFCFVFYLQNFGRVWRVLMKFSDIRNISKLI